MIAPKLIILLFIGCMTLLWACNSAPTSDMAAATISEALANNDIDAARKKADEFFAPDVRLDTVGLQRLCMLSVSLTRLSQSGEHGGDYAAHALKCYDVVMRRDSVAANQFYDSLDGDDYNYANLLRQLAGRVDARSAGIYIDESENDEN